MTKHYFELSFISGFMVGIEFIWADEDMPDIKWGLAIDLGIFRVVCVQE